MSIDDSVASLDDAPLRTAAEQLCSSAYQEFLAAGYASREKFLSAPRVPMPDGSTAIDPVDQKVISQCRELEQRLAEDLAACLTLALGNGFRLTGIRRNGHSKNRELVVGPWELHHTVWSGLKNSSVRSYNGIVYDDVKVSSDYLDLRQPFANKGVYKKEIANKLLKKKFARVPYDGKRERVVKEIIAADARLIKSEATIRAEIRLITDAAVNAWWGNRITDDECQKYWSEPSTGSEDRKPLTLLTEGHLQKLRTNRRLLERLKKGWFLPRQK